MNEKRSFDATLTELQKEIRPNRFDLQGLSDLSSAQADRLRPVWAQLPVDRRRWVVHTLSELAEDNIEFDFTAVFKVALSDADVEVRRAAVEGVWESDDLEVAAALRALLASDASDEVRAAAASALGHFAYLAEMQELPDEEAERTRAALLSVIHGQAPLEVKRRAVEAIGFYSGDEEVWKAIADAYASGEPSMRTSAMFAMGRNCDARWLPNVLKEMESKEAQMRFEAARAAGEIEDRRAVPRLLRLLVDPDTEVRLTAIQSLGVIGGEPAIQALRYLVDSDDPAVTEAAEEALAEAEFAASPLDFDITGEVPDRRGHDHDHDHPGHSH